MQLTALYRSDGTISQIVIADERGETVEVMMSLKDSPTRELQRADEVIQGMLEYRKARTPA